MQRNLVNMSAKGAGTVMVLTVYVVCNRPAHRNETSARSDRKEPPFGEEYVDHIGKTHTALTTDDSRRFIETENTVETMTLHQVATSIEARIPVTATHAKGKQGALLGGLENSRDPVIPSGSKYVTVFGPGIASPGKNTFCG
jgi:hypothetical protein